MEKKIPVKTLYLLFIISFGLIALGIGSTYAVFTANTEIPNPITFTTNLSYSGDIIETKEVKVPAGEIVTVTLNISNNSDSVLNYVSWYITDSEKVSVVYNKDLYYIESTSELDLPQGTIESGLQKTFNIDIRNNDKHVVTVTIGASSSSESIVLDSKMKELPYPAYAVASSDDNSLTFYKTGDTITWTEMYNDKVVDRIYTGFETSTDISWDASSYEIISIEDTISPVSTAYWFSGLICESIDLTNLDTSNVNDMYGMFEYAGNSVETFEIIGLDTWDTSSVTDMRYMFSSAGYSATEWNLDLSSWDTSSVTDMSYMFSYTASYAIEWNLNLSGWDTSSVTDMSYMFEYAGGDAEGTFNIVGLDDWDTRNVEYMPAMFSGSGFNASEWNIGNISNWDTGSVIDMTAMFAIAGANADYYLDLREWNVSNVSGKDSFSEGVEDKIDEPIWPE